MAGSTLSATEHSENAVIGIGARVDTYPDRPEGAQTGRLAWEDNHIVRSAEATDRDPATRRDFSGTYWTNLAMLALRVEGGDGVFAEDTPAPPIVFQLPAEPSGLVVYNLPQPPPGVQLSATHDLDFAAKTLTVQVTIKAGSVWPESGARSGEDPSRRYWEWSPWDHGAFDPDPSAAISDREAIVGTDVALDLVNAYRGQIWDPQLIGWASIFYLTP